MPVVFPALKKKPLTKKIPDTLPLTYQLNRY